MASEEDKLIHIWTTNISFSSAFLSQMTIIIFHPPNSVYTASSNSNQFTFFMWKYPFTISKPFPLWFNGKNHSIANPVEYNLNPYFKGWEFWALWRTVLTSDVGIVTIDHVTKLWHMCDGGYKMSQLWNIGAESRPLVFKLSQYFTIRYQVAKLTPRGVTRYWKRTQLW